MRRGWGRGKAALTVLAGLFVGVFLLVVVTAAPLWDQIVEFVNELPEYWDEITQSDAFEKITSSTGTDDKVARR